MHVARQTVIVRTCIIFRLTRCTPAHTLPDMDNLLTPSEVKALAKERGITMAEVCRRAGINATTFNRWERGETEPGLGVYRRIVAALRDVAA